MTTASHETDETVRCCPIHGESCWSDGGPLGGCCARCPNWGGDEPTEYATHQTETGNAEQAMPRVGARVRVNETHTSGTTVVVESEVYSWIEHSDGATEIVLTCGFHMFFPDVRDGWTSTWEEMEPPAPAPPEEPPVGAIVLDKEGDVWRSAVIYGEGMWRCLTDDLAYRSWTRLNDECGPLTRLVPETETSPRQLAGELVEALRRAAMRLESHANAYHDGDKHPGSLHLCDALECSDDSNAVEAARALLARATAALTDTTSTEEGL